MLVLRRVFRARRTHALAFALMSALLSACGGDSKTDPGDPTGPTGPTGVTVASVTVEGLTAPLALGATAQLTARVTGSNGQQLTDRTVSWSSSDVAVATVSNTGLLTAVRGGTATITATVESRSGSITATVNNPVPTVTAITPTTLEIGQGANLIVSGTNFVPGASIRVNGNAVTTNFVSSSSLTATLAPQGTAGTLAISVANPTPGGGASGSINLTITNPPPAGPCTQSITLGQNLFSQPQSGVLTNTDCQLSSGAYTDIYRIQLTFPLTLRVVMTSTAVDSYLRITDATGRVLIENDNSAGNRNARIDATFSAGTFFIQTTTRNPNEFGPYTLTVGTFFAGSHPACAFTSQAPQVTFGTTILGTFSNTDCPLGDGTFMDLYRLVITQTTSVQIELNSNAVDSYLFLFDSTGTVIDENDDGGGGLNSRLIRILQPGTYFIGANSIFFGGLGVFGPYTLAVTQR